MGSTYYGKKVIVTRFVGPEKGKACCDVRTRYQVNKPNGASFILNHCEWTELQALSDESLFSD